MIESRVAARHCDGFTLIEILVVVAIIAILASIALYNFMEAQTRAKVTRAQADMRTITIGIESYRVDNLENPLMNPNVYSNDKDPASLLIDTPHNNFLYYEIEDGHMAEAEQWLGPGAGVPRSLTTPVAYMSSHPPLDPFIGKKTLAETGAWHHFCMMHCSYYFLDFYGLARFRAQCPPAWNDDFRWPIVYPVDFRLNGRDAPMVHPEWALICAGPDQTYTIPNPAGEPLSTFQMTWTVTWSAMLEGRFATYDPTNGTDSAGDIWRTNAGAL